MYKIDYAIVKGICKNLLYLRFLPVQNREHY